MDPRDKERHKEEHEDSKKERKSKNNQLLYRESQDYQLGLNPLRNNQAEEMEVMIKKSV
jgi:hypothetical protein